MFKCSANGINAVLAKIANERKLYVPADNKDGNAVYTEWTDGIELSGALNTAKSPKDFFFPQVENLMEFKVEGKSIEVNDIREASEDFVVFGVRACDVRSFDILDRVFLVEPFDSYYASRREHGVIIAMSCRKNHSICLLFIRRILHWHIY